MKRNVPIIAAIAVLAIGWTLVPAIAVGQCGSEGERGCCSGFERDANGLDGPCAPGLIEDTQAGCGGSCECTDGTPSALGTCRAPSLCGQAGQRGCCLDFAEAADGGNACATGLIAVPGCAGNCLCGGSGKGELAELVCTTATPCGAKGQRACCESTGECVAGKECGPGLDKVDGCAGDCFCGGPGADSGKVTNHTCTVIENIAEPGTAWTPPEDGPMCPYRGYTDMHLHLFGHHAHGGALIAGEPFSFAGINSALRHDHSWDEPTVKATGAGTDPFICPPYLSGLCGDYPIHRGHTLLGVPGGVGTGDRAASNFGAPAFNGWPLWSSTVHQQSYWVWLERAWRGGLRLAVMLAVNNEILCESHRRLAGVDCDDTMAPIDQQIESTYEMQTYIDSMFGGPGQGWFRVVTSPAEAREVIADGKLAVVLGIEVDNLFNCRFGQCDEAFVEDQLDEYYDLGVRHVFPVHNFDNAFGGAATWNSTVNIGNRQSEGFWFDAEECSDEGFGFKLTFSFTDWLANAFAYLSLGSPGPYPQQATCNKLGLSPLGESFIEMLIDRGMIIDIDHMSRNSVDDTLDIAEVHNAPVAASHAHFFSLYPQAHRHERMRTPEQLQRMKALGGMVTAFTRDAYDVDHMDERQALQYGSLVDDCRHSSKTWAQSLQFAVDVMEAPVAFGTDFNGVAPHIAPRFGHEACGEVANERAAQIVAGNPLEYPFTIQGFGTFERINTGHRAFDFNTDGLAHIGLLPDLVAELSNVGVEPYVIDSLMRSAEGYIEMWERAEGTYEPPPAPDCAPVVVAAGPTCTANPTVGGTAPSDPLISTTVSPVGPYALGTTAVDVTRNFACGGTAELSCTAQVTVVDQTAPKLTVGPKLLGVQCTAALGELPDLGNQTVSDNCTEAPSVASSLPGGLPLGDVEIVWTATDAAGNTTKKTQTVEAVDTKGPIIEEISPNHDALWPADRQMHEVILDVTAIDACHTKGIDCAIQGVSVSDSGGELGLTTPDWLITGPLTVDLRAERSPSGGGRTYEVSVECTDPSGNASTAVVDIDVPVLSPDGPSCVSPPGDVDGTGSTSISDVQCALLVTLWEVSGAADALPSCIQNAPLLADLNCDGAVQVPDVLMLVRLALETPLDAALDTDSDGCADTCEPGCAAFANACPDDGNPCANLFCAEPTVSAADCGELGWVGSGGGSAGVCAESIDGLGGCSGSLSHSAAEAYCTVAGARLCTLDELQADETQGTGCGYDNARVWSATRCSAGAYWTAAGWSANDSAHPLECTPVEDGTAVVRCCADAEPSLVPTACVSFAAKVVCNDGDPCTADRCDPIAGGCTTEPITTGPTCSDDSGGGGPDPECTSSGDCPAGQFCDAGDCAPSQLWNAPCDSDSQCLAQCAEGACGCNSTTNQGCPGSAPYCLNTGSLVSQADNVCVLCKKDSHCSPGQFCSESNVCTNDKSIGAPCTDNDQCETGICSTFGPRTCVCGTDSQCPGAQVCFEPIFAKNFCAECKNNNQCSSGEFCGEDGTCGDLKEFGEVCASDSECIAQCPCGTCGCNATTNAGCPGSTPYCLNPGSIFTQHDNYCVECKKDSHCADSEYCGASNTCVPDKPLGDSCDDNDQCLSGNCSIYTPRTCACAKDTDCPGGEVCFEPITKKNFCAECKNGNQCSAVEYCDDAGTCQPQRLQGKACTADEQCVAQCAGGTCGCNDTTNAGCPVTSPYCKNNGDILSQADNTCVDCTKDSHCLDSQFCGSDNTCKADLALGSSCDDNDQCLSSNCSIYTPRTCACAQDSDCPSGTVCFEPITAKNFCAECKNANQCGAGEYCDDAGTCQPQRLQGESCSADEQCVAQCAGGTCGCNDTTNAGCPVGEPYCKNNGDIFSQADNTCVDCTTNSHCPSSQYCGSSNSCLNDKGLGFSCGADAECQSGSCADFGGVCQCADNGDCGSGQYCDQKDFAPNTCENLLPEHAVCGSDDSKCASGFCGCKPDGRCMSENFSKSVGQTCFKNSQCSSNNCGGLCGAPTVSGVCKCTSDSHCSSTQYCGSGGSCVAKKPDCDTCDADKKCLSNNCTASVLGTCVTPNSVGTGGSCCHTDQCTGSRSCQGGDCVCTLNSHCSSNQYCDTDPFSPNQCKAKKSQGTTCGNDSQCLSGCCKGFIVKTCKSASNCD